MCLQSECPGVIMLNADTRAECSLKNSGHSPTMANDTRTIARASGGDPVSDGSIEMTKGEEKGEADGESGRILECEALHYSSRGVTRFNVGDSQLLAHPKNADCSETRRVRCSRDADIPPVSPSGPSDRKMPSRDSAGGRRWTKR